MCSSDLYVRVTLTNGQDGATTLQSAELRVAGNAVDPTPGPGDPSGSAAPGDPSAPGGSSQGPGSGSPGASGTVPGFLARTGASIGIGLVALGLVAAGVVLMVRRRRGAGAPEDGAGAETREAETGTPGGGTKEK